MTHLYYWRKNMMIVSSNFFIYKDDDFFLIRMNIRFFLINLSSMTVLLLHIVISKLLNWYWVINIINLCFLIAIDVILLSLFCRIRQYVFILDKKYNLHVKIIHMNYLNYYQIYYTNTMNILNFKLSWLTKPMYCGSL